MESMESSAHRRDLSEFCEQLADMRRRFSKMDNCERTIALYYLAVGLPFANARFLQRALEQAVAKASDGEARALERNANDPAFVGAFVNESAPAALSNILRHLPLLRPGNRDALDCYNAALRRILSDELLPNFKIYNECIEILSYVFVHPAFSGEDKKFFKHLLYCVSHSDRYDNPSSTKIVDDAVFFGVTASASAPSRVSSPNYSFEDRPARRSNSLTPGRERNRESTLSYVSKPRSFSLSAEQPSPFDGDVHVCSSDLRPCDADGVSAPPARQNLTKGVLGWLKSLRLHKYSWLFHNVTYEQMMAFTDDRLETLGITKGARNKLVLNIAKLKERSSTLSEMESQVLNGGDLSNALKKLKNIYHTPLTCCSPGEDLPSQFIRVMGKVCTQIVMLRQPPEEMIVNYIDICERAEQSDSFSEEQKRRLAFWRAHLGRCDHSTTYQQPYLYNNYSNNLTVGYRSHSSKYYCTKSSSSYQPGYAHKSSSYPNMRASPAVGAHRHSLGSTTLQSQLGNLNKQFYGTSIMPNSDGNRPLSAVVMSNMEDGENVQSKKETSTYALNPEAFSFHNSPTKKNADIESSLESLCLQMMEHALGP